MCGLCTRRRGTVAIGAPLLGDFYTGDIPIELVAIIPSDFVAVISNYQSQVAHRKRYNTEPFPAISQSFRVFLRL